MAVGLMITGIASIGVRHRVIRDVVDRPSPSGGSRVPGGDSGRCQCPSGGDLIALREQLAARRRLRHEWLIAVQIAGAGWGLAVHRYLGSVPRSEPDRPTHG